MFNINDDDILKRVSWALSGEETVLPAADSFCVVAGGSGGFFMMFPLCAQVMLWGPNCAHPQSCHCQIWGSIKYSSVFSSNMEIYLCCMYAGRAVRGP